MRSPLTLGIVFVSIAGLAAFATPGIHLGPMAWALVVLLAIAGLLVMTRLRIAYYAGLVAGAATAISGLVSWTGIGGSQLSLPVHPGISVVVGLYLCMRVAVAHRMFGPREHAI